MAKNILIVGSGRQGISVAYDILKNSKHNVIISDINQDCLDQSIIMIKLICTIKENLNRSCLIITLLIKQNLLK